MYTALRIFAASLLLNVVLILVLIGVGFHSIF